MADNKVMMTLSREEAEIISCLRNIRKLYGLNWQHQREYLAMLIDEMTEPNYD